MWEYQLMPAAWEDTHVAPAHVFGCDAEKRDAWKFGRRVDGYERAFGVRPSSNIAEIKKGPGGF
jgi:hypothetical protein